jgi:hypothetical protein
MSPADPALAEPCTAPPLDGGPAPMRAMIEAQLAMLTRLAQIGMELAEACGAQARTMAARAEAGDAAAPSAEQRQDPAFVFARVARAVRMTIALQSRLMKDLADLDRTDARAAAARKGERRARLARLVDQAAEVAVEARREAGCRAGGPYWPKEAVEDEIERLSAETYERLTDAEDGDLWGRPFEEVVAGICADLGLSPEWTARLAAATAAPMEPSATPTPDPEPGAPPGARAPPQLSSSGEAAKPRRPGDPAEQVLPMRGRDVERLGPRVCALGTSPRAAPEDDNMASGRRFPDP